jgi:hypothetical protein
MPIDLDRSTLADWVGSASALVDPLVTAIRDCVFRAHKISAQHSGHTGSLECTIVSRGKLSGNGRRTGFTRSGRTALTAGGNAASRVSSSNYLAPCSSTAILLEPFRAIV